jgi:hypothetical protein
VNSEMANATQYEELGEDVDKARKMSEVEIDERLDEKAREKAQQEATPTAIAAESIDSFPSLALDPTMYRRRGQSPALY